MQGGPGAAGVRRGRRGDAGGGGGPPGAAGVRRTGQGWAAPPWAGPPPADRGSGGGGGGGVDDLTAGDGEVDLGVTDLGGRQGEDVLAEHGQVGPVAGAERAQFLLAVVDVGDAGREGGHGRGQRQRLAGQERALDLGGAGTAQARGQATVDGHVHFLQR